MKMKQFFHLTFIFLILACLAHTASAITDQKRWNAPLAVEENYITVVYNN